VLDLRAIREDPEPARRALARRAAAERLDEALALDERWRELTARVEALRAEQNQGSKEVVSAASPEERQAVIGRLKRVSEELKALDPEQARVEAELQAVVVTLPNIPDDTAPDGESDEDNVEISRWGTPPEFSFEPKDHVEIGQALGILDLEAAARTSGSRFAYLLGDAVRLQFALVQYALAFGARHGLIPVTPPVLVRERAMFGTGFFPTDEAQIYATRDDDLYLVGTAEVPLAALHADEFFDPEDLPRRYLGYSTCFRREAGAAGKDTRGIFRVHQFDKVEMFSFVLPETSRDEHERLLAMEEDWVRSLELPYRVVNVCLGDLGSPAAKKYDIEAWFPGQGRYREITSTSNTTDYQARRLEIRVRLDEGNRPVHTLNGTLCAIGRTLIALIENGQQEDGTFSVPEALGPYLPPSA
jgi:seryl-tRNA synthetase